MIIYQEIEKLPQNTLSINTISKTMGLISQEKLSGMYIASSDSYEEPQFHAPIYKEEGDALSDGHLTCSIEASLNCFRTSTDDRPDTDWFMQFLPTIYTAPFLNAVRVAGYIDQGNEGMNMKIGNDTQSDTKGVVFGNDFTSGMIYVIKGGYSDDDGNITYVDLTNNSVENNLQEGYPPNAISSYSINNLSTDFPYNVYPFGSMVAHSGSISVSTNFKLFTTKLAMDTYLKTGIAIDPINEGGEPIQIDVRPEHKYIHSETCETDVQSKSADYTVIHNNRLDMYNSDLARLETAERWIAGFLDGADGDVYNIRLKSRDVSSDYFKFKEERDGTSREGTDIRQILPYDDRSVPNPHRTGRGWTYIDLFGDNPYYFGKLSTNIPIFTSEEKADEYLDGEISEGESLNGGGNYSGASSDIGEMMGETEFNTPDMDGVMSRAHIMSADALEDVASILYDDNEITNLIDGLKMNGENPMSFICDLYYVPFDMNYFCNTSESISTFHFGTYEKILDHTYKRVTKSAIKRTMFTTQITGSFNDFRDYYANYYLYLPYTPIINLSAENWLYHTLRVDVSVDVYTGAVKYWLLNDDRLMQTVEGSIRVSLPISSADKYQGAVGRIDSAFDLTGDVISMGKGLKLEAKGKDSGQRGLDNAQGLVNDYMSLVKATPKKMSGSFSPSVAINDPLDAFLIIEQREIEYPATLRSVYGLPDNDVNTVSSRTGYIEVENLQLKSGALLEELNEISSICSGGIIV